MNFATDPAVVFNANTLTDTTTEYRQIIVFQTVMQNMAMLAILEQDMNIYFTSQRQFYV